MATKKLEIKPGTEVHLAGAHGKHFPAKVTKVHEGDQQLVDLEVDVGGVKKLMVTGSPLDETGKRCDSWHPVEAATEAKAETKV
jgi:hypothetical protein